MAVPPPLDKPEPTPIKTVTDRYGDEVQVGDTIEFYTLYGNRTAVVTSLVSDVQYGPVARFAPQQIGPAQTFDPISEWPLCYGMQQFALANPDRPKSDHQRYIKRLKEGKTPPNYLFDGSYARDYREKYIGFNPLIGTKTAPSR
jgi:hypothetical protein